MSFHLGKPILVMLVVALVSGGGLALRQQRDTRADVELWVFAQSHYKVFTGEGKPDDFVTPLETFTAETGKTVEARHIQHRAMNVRLATLFLADRRGPEVPDAVEVEIGSVGRFFRPPVHEVGFLPLNELIREHGWEGKVIESRFAPWSKQGVIFGIPHDVHPVTITYRDDLFREAGIDLATCQTWDEFIAAAQAYQRYWRERGVSRRWTIEWPESNAGVLVTLLLQRGINLVDDVGRIHLEDPRVLDTLLMYTRLAVGPGRIGASASPGEQLYSQDLASGFIAAIFTADWRLKDLRDFAPDLAGKMRVMRLPAFPDSRYRSSTQGGTMIAIPRNARDPELSWKLIEILYLRPEGLQDTMRSTYILPPVKAMWDDPIHQEPDPFFGGQRVRALNVELARDLPPRYVTPASGVAESALSMVLIRAIAHAREHGEAGLEDACRRWLADAADDLRRRVAHGSFDEPASPPRPADPATEATP
jgi:arabinosaccharide transport system substrate-binding protein